MFRQALWLVKNGVPFDVAFSWSDAERFAAGIVFSEFEGKRFDWTEMAFREQE